MNNFLVSVADAIGRDANTGQGIFMGKANISSAFTVSTTAVETRGGKGNPLLYVFYHSRKIDVKISSVVFDKQFIGMNVGALSVSGTVTAVYTECIQLSSGVGTLTNTPLSDVVVFLPDGTIQNITPVGKTITVVSGASLAPTVVYDYSTTADQITASTSTPPMVIDLVLLAEVRDNSNTIVDYLQIHIPRFQISGNYTLSLAANGVSNSDLDGMALSVDSTDCVTGSYFAKITEIAAVAASNTITSIVAIPSTLVYSVAAGLPATQSIKVLGIAGVANTNLTTSCSFVAGSGSMVSTGKYTAGLHTGLITGGSAIVSGDSGSVVVSYLSGSTTLTDWVNLNATA